MCIYLKTITYLVTLPCTKHIVAKNIMTKKTNNCKQKMTKLGGVKKFKLELICENHVLSQNLKNVCWDKIGVKKSQDLYQH